MKLDLRVPEAAVYVLVGPNGAGKTTLLRTLVGMARRDGGTVDVLGMDPGTRGDEVRARIGYVPEGHGVGYPWMTVGRLLEHGPQRAGIARREVPRRQPPSAI